MSVRSVDNVNVAPFQRTGWWGDSNTSSGSSGVLVSVIVPTSRHHRGRE